MELEESYHCKSYLSDINSTYELQVRHYDDRNRNPEAHLYQYQDPRPRLFMTLLSENLIEIDSGHGVSDEEYKISKEILLARGIYQEFLEQIFIDFNTSVEKVKLARGTKAVDIIDNVMTAAVNMGYDLKQSDQSPTMP